MDQERYTHWKELYEDAKKTMAEGRGYGVLIEVAAQHPLVNGIRPNPEFKARLREAMRLYWEFSKIYGFVVIYVPGSRHQHNKVVDDVSLSTAGKNYLIEHGIPRDVIYADESNEKYKGSDGVYNSSDECYVACKLYKELGARELHCVCSPAQAMRKVLSYIQFGYVPNVHTVSCSEMHHDYIDELFFNIPKLLLDGQGLQGDSPLGREIRKRRKPSLHRG